MHLWLRSLHDTYESDIVRVSPTELSFISSQAWKDIYSTRPGHPGFPKDPVAFGGKNSILTANNADHSRMRRLLSHAFSEKALREQEGLIKIHVNNLIDGIKNQLKTSPEGTINFVDWYHWATFDIIGDLAFGESFKCLHDAKWTPWVSKLVSGLKAVALISVATRFTLLERLIRLYISRSNLVKDSIQHGRLSREKVERRLAAGDNGRPDFMTYVLRHNESKGGMTEAEIQRNASVFINAGSQTTATFLCGATWFMVQNPSSIKQICNEITNAMRESGKTSAEQLNLKELNEMKYLHAFLQESHRMYPGSLAGLPRSSSPPGDTAAGIFVPGGTGVHMNQYAAYRSPRNFHLPDSFNPERWLGDDPRFEKDRREVLQPFAMGPRNCIGKNLASAEILLILVRVAAEFEIEMCGETEEGWLEQGAWFGWEKKPLVLGVRERNGKCK